jgi:Co/Zn/Cd efflux system component
VFNEAIPLAAVGLVVNLLGAWLLHDDGNHAHEHEHHHHDHEDHDLRDAMSMSSPMLRFRCSF